MVEKRDSLGRRYPDLDRSAIAAKGAQTKKEKYGSDYYAKLGAIGGRARTRGYLGKLKDEGKTSELATVIQKGIEKRRANGKKKAAAKTDKITKDPSVSG